MESAWFVAKSHLAYATAHLLRHAITTISAGVGCRYVGGPFSFPIDGRYSENGSAFGIVQESNDWGPVGFGLIDHGAPMQPIDDRMTHATNRLFADLPVLFDAARMIDGAKLRGSRTAAQAEFDELQAAAIAAGLPGAEHRWFEALWSPTFGDDVAPFLFNPPLDVMARRVGHTTRLPSERASNNWVYAVEAGTLDGQSTQAFSKGQCHALAYALSEATGWPIVGVVLRRRGAGRLGQPELVHVAVEMPDGRYLDIDGVMSRQQFLSRCAAGPKEIRALTDRELGRVMKGGLLEDLGLVGTYKPANVPLARAFVQPVFDLALSQGADIVGMLQGAASKLGVGR